MTIHSNLRETRFRCKECQYIALSMADALHHRNQTGHAKMKEEEYKDNAFSP